MRFVPYAEIGGVPNIVVDGAATGRTLLTLSHWPRSGTPGPLKGDTSTETVFNYLDSPAHHVDAEAVSNNHFDEDGLAGILAMIDRAVAERHRDLLLDVAQAGDFGVFKSRTAARIAFTLSAYANADTSPFGRGLFDRLYPQVAAELYLRLLELLPRLLVAVDEYDALWRGEDAKLTYSEVLLDRGVITITEQPDLDLAIVRLPADLTPYRVHRFTQERLAECHPFAIHNRTASSRVLTIHGGRVELQYRYEGWVQMVSRRPAPRIDLAELAAELNQGEDQGQGRWTFDGVDELTPRLSFDGPGHSAWEPDHVVQRIEHYLRTGPPAWNPYD